MIDFKEILEHHILDQPVMVLPSSLGWPLTITKNVVMMWVVSIAAVVLFTYVGRQRKARKVSFLAALVEPMVLFIRDEVVRPALGERTRRYLPYFLSLFFFILFCNLAGMIPWGATATANISVTGSLALCTFCLIHLAGVREQGLSRYIKHYVTAGPLWLAPLMVPIELIGLVTKTFALSIRLFANMIAGHIVVLAFLSLIFIFGAVNAAVGLTVAAPFAVLLALFVSLVELFVAFLQAYIFTFLTALFVGQSAQPAH